MNWTRLSTRACLLEGLTLLAGVVSLVSFSYRKQDGLPLTNAFCLAFFLSLFSTYAWSASSELEQRFGPKPLDGVYVEALQTYSNPRNSHFGFDFGVWPLNPYYNGFSLDANYTYYFNKDRGWEIFNMSYLYTVDTGLTTELADSYKVDPKTIERVNFILSSNYLLTLAYGKFIFFQDNIRYFRSNLIIGPALIATNQGTDFGVCFGWGFETFVNDRISWKLGIRDNYAIGNNHPNNLAFTVGTSYGF